jgi:hypothetical protein
MVVFFCCIVGQEEANQVYVFMVAYLVEVVMRPQTPPRYSGNGLTISLKRKQTQQTRVTAVYRICSQFKLT